MEAEALVARKLHAALTDARARGSVRLHEGQWFVTLMRGLPRQHLAYPPAGKEHDEWMVAMLTKLEEAAGVRPVVEEEVVEADD